MQFTLNNRLLIIYITLLAASIFTVVLVGNQYSREHMEKLIESSAHSQVKANVHLINTKFASLTDELRSIAATSEIQSMRWERQNHYLQKLAQERKRNSALSTWAAICDPPAARRAR